MNKIFKVAAVIDPFTIVISGGTLDGIKDYYRFLVYSLDGEEIYHPDTKKLLGKLEIIKGTGFIHFLQDQMCTIKSDTYKTITPMDIESNATINSLYLESQLKVGDKKLLPFKNVKVGDYVKVI